MQTRYVHEHQKVDEFHYVLGFTHFFSPSSSSENYTYIEEICTSNITKFRDLMSTTKLETLIISCFIRNL